MRAEDVVFNGFGGVSLHQGHMLVGGGMEHDCGAVGVENVVYALGILDVGYEGGDGERGELRRELAVDVVDAVFAAAEEQELCGGIGCDLARQLGAYGTAGAGNKHCPAAETPGYARAVELYLRALKQVFYLHLAQRDFDVLVKTAVEARHN
ncbi:MAG: hypothetical protein DDT38_01651 [Firmicutes bacterium]|nr:hypothetical protein [candidate division NPL-UPA2 bacterium]